MFRNIKPQFMFDNVDCPTYCFNNDCLVEEVSKNNGSYLSCTIKDRITAGLPLNSINPTILHDSRGFESLTNEVINNSDNNND